MEKAKIAAPKRIEVFVRSATQHGQNLIQGIAHYARPLKNWIIGIQEPGITVLKQTLASRPDGIIMQVGDIEEMHRLMEKSGIPHIDLSNTSPDASIARVCVDNEAIGRMAAEYFLQNRYRQFGFVGEEKNVFLC
jgi:LacI family transcriptional regulator